MTRPVPPYFAFRTFKAFLVKLRGNGMPAQIDKSLMEDKSPSIQSQLRNSLLFFALVDDKNQATFDLHELVRLIQAKNEARDAAWKRVLQKAYPDLLERDLLHTTTEVIRDSLLRRGLSSQHTLNKAVNFFCLAVREARIPLSSNVKPYLGRRKVGKKKGALKDERQGALTFHSTTETPQMPPNGLSAWEQLVEKLPTFNETWPVELQKHWLQNYEKLLDMQRDIRTSNGQDLAK